MYAFISKGRYYFCAVIGSAITDHPELKIFKALPEHALNSVVQSTGFVVGGDQYGNSWCGWVHMLIYNSGNFLCQSVACW